MLTKLTRDSLEFKQYKFGRTLVDTFDDNTDAIELLIKLEAQPYLKNFRAYVNEIKKKLSCFKDMPPEPVTEEAIKNEPRVIRFKKLLNDQIEEYNLKNKKLLEMAKNVKIRKTENYTIQQMQLQEDKVQLESFKLEYEKVKIKARGELELKSKEYRLDCTKEAEAIYTELLQEKMGVNKLEENVSIQQNLIISLESKLKEANFQLHNLGVKSAEESTQWKQQWEIIKANISQIVESALRGDRFKQKEVDPEFATSLQDLVITHFHEWKTYMEKAKKVKIDLDNLRLTFDIKTKDIREENEKKIKSELASYKESSFNFAIYKKKQ